MAHEQDEIVFVSIHHYREWTIHVGTRQAGKETTETHGKYPTLPAALRTLCVKYGVNQELERQLATAQEEAEKGRAAQHENARLRQEIERLLARDAEWAESQAEAVTRYAEARVLLEAFAQTPPDSYSAESSYPVFASCPYCGKSEDVADTPVTHAPDCAWVQARAFLADKEPTNG